MERVNVDCDRPSPAIVERAAALLQTGAVVAYPTETFYGLGASPFEEVAYRKILELKGRIADKPLPLIVSDMSQLQSLCDSVPSPLRRLAGRFWPGPLTLVVPARADLGGALAGFSTVAVRVSGLVLARELARACGFPLTATSANPSDAPPAQTADEVESTLGAGVDLLLDGGPTPGGKPSTIVDLTGLRPRLLRRGAVAFEEITSALE